MKRFNAWYSAFFAIALAACDAAAPGAESDAGLSDSAEASETGSIAWAVAGSWRTDAQTARDPWRHPEETLTFFGVEPSDTVVELFPGSGWYTEILGPYLKRGGGKLVAAGPDPAASDYNRRLFDGYRAAYADRPETYGEIEMTVASPAHPDFAAPDSADVVLTFRNVHNWMAGRYADVMIAGAFRALKPGGVFGVVEHRLPSAWDQDLSARTGYVHEAYVIQLAEAAGFELVESSEINANLTDPADHPMGVWMLPPNLRAPEAGSDAAATYDREHYLAIGESDRMTLKFRKPTNDAPSAVDAEDQPEP